MKKTIFFTVALIMLLSLAAGCTGNQASVNTSLTSVQYPKSIGYENYEAQQELREQNAVDESIINSIKEFSAESASTILSGKKDNACYSPISLYMALAMLSTGAKGETQDELLTLLREDDTEYLSEQMGKLFRLMYVDNEMSKLYMTNSLWMNGDEEFNQEFVDNAMISFYAASNKLDFNDSEAGEVISSWISDNTNGLLKPEIKIDPIKLIYIINTIYLKDEWKDNFDEDATKEDVFSTADGESVSVDFMTRKLGCTKLIGQGFKTASLYLKNTGKMTFVLPDEGVDVSSLLESPESIAAMTSNENSEYGEVLITLPKFNFDTEFDLKESLESLGVESVFKDNADLTGISDMAGVVSEVKQGSNISINEDGVEAAAYTYIAVDTAAAPGENEVLELKFDRPFIFVLQSRENVPLFIGVVQNPAE